MIGLILQHVLAEVESGDYAGAVAKLNAKTISVRNPKLWTIGDLSAAIGTEGAAVVAYTIEKAGIGDSPQAALFRGAFLAVNNNGIQLHTDERQTMIDQLAAGGGWSDSLKNAVKAAGVTYHSVMSSNNLSDVTEEQVKTAYETYLAEIAAEQDRQSKINQKNEMIQLVNSLFNSNLAGYMDSNEVLDKATLVQKFRDAATQLENS